MSLLPTTFLCRFLCQCWAPPPPTRTPAQTTETSAQTAETTAKSRESRTAATEEAKNYKSYESILDCSALTKDAPHHIRNNKNIVMKAVQKNVYALKFATPELQNDKEVIMAAVQSWGYAAIQFASPSLQNDREVITTAIKNDRTGRALKYASPSLQNDKHVVMTAIQSYDGTHLSPLEFASPDLRNNCKEVVLAAVQKNGKALGYASPDLQNDREVTMAAVQRTGAALEFASPDLQNDRQVVMAAVSKDGWALEYASPDLQKDKQVVLVAVKKSGYALKYASPDIQNDKQVVMAAVSKDGWALEYASPELRNDMQVAIAAVQQYGNTLQLVSPELRQDKNFIITAVTQHPDAIKFVPELLQRDPDILIASRMYDKDYTNATARQANGTSKIVLSTRFSLNPTSRSEATNFTALFKKSKYVQNGGNNFIVYAPNAFDKKSCDPEWTGFEWPCRGTIDTCQYSNILTADGHPTDDCCWRYSFRSQLQEAKDTGGFMLQVVETNPTYKDDPGKENNAKLGNGQKIELDMANMMGIKVFQVYCPISFDIECTFEDHHIDVITKEISQWYNDDKQDMSVTIIRQRSK